ncbi:MAG: response regulator [Candidatus Omnitrophota bacterium]|jgi:two-component system alkaline phosphatase synthesis response regulator PhoP
MKRILIIDDDEEICKLVKAGLERSGDFSVLYAITGKEGLRLAQAEKPNLVLLDVRLPDIDGFEILREIKQNKEIAGTPVVMLTALGDERLKTEAAHSYGEGYLTKPVELKDIKLTIESILGKH